MNFRRPLAGRPTAILLSRTPTEYVNVRQRECPNNCCAGEIASTTADAVTVMVDYSRVNSIKPAQFPVDPIRDSYYSQSQLLNDNDNSNLFNAYYFERQNSGQQSSTSNEIDELEKIEDGFHSNDSTQSLLVWRQRNGKLQKRRSQLPLNGAVLRLEQKSRFSSPWWASNKSSPVKKSFQQDQQNSRAFPAKTTQTCCLFPWLIGALLLLSIALLFWTVILIVEQQMELQQKLTDTQEPYSRLLKEDVQKHNDTSRQLMAMFIATKIRQNLKWIASKVHVAGTEEQLDLMDKLADEYQSLGFDVRKYEYPEVLLSYPDYNSPNTIHAWNGRSLQWEKISSGIGGLPKNAKIDTELKKQLEDDPKMFVWWNAYSRNGTATGELIYANYGTQEDFDFLIRMNISIDGKIVLIRYGGIFRGDKVHLAQTLGAVGVVLYSDPFDYVPGNKTFPDDLWLPPTGSQRGTLYRGNGDPETPFLPSLPYVHREYTEDDLRLLGKFPNIPVTSIGYADAQKLFARMDGQPVQWSRWAGSLPVIYRLTSSLLIRLDVNTRNERRKIKNFIAKMDGREEPDRWILLGNHADAWTKGSIDPGTGTSIMLEMARVLSKYSKLTGWRPRRSILFCQWDAEEFGLIGSTEWVEQNLRQLQHRAVAYINVDNFNGNLTLSIKSVPLLYRLIVDAASRVSQPVQSELENGRQTLLDSWRFHNTRATLPGDRAIPFFQFPHTGSDFQPFIAYAGIPVADLRMENVPYSYMLYHTAYEVPWLNENFLDPEGKTSVALGQFWLEIVRQLADQMVIPFNVEDYGIALADYVAKSDTQMKLAGIHNGLTEEFYTSKLEFLQHALQKFQKIATIFQRVIHAINSGEKPISLLQREQLNHRLLSLERCFLLDQGLLNDERREFRHSVFSAPGMEQNSGTALPILLDPMAKWLQATQSNDSIEAEAQLEKLRLGFSWLQYGVECAEEMLRLDRLI